MDMNDTEWSRADHERHKRRRYSRNGRDFIVHSCKSHVGCPWITLKSTGRIILQMIPNYLGYLHNEDDKNNLFLLDS